MNTDDASADIVSDGRISHTTPAIAFRLHEAAWRQDRAADDRMVTRCIERGAIRKFDRASAHRRNVPSSQRVVLTTAARAGDRRRKAAFAQDLSQDLGD
jgi:hypothetical protein